METVKSLLLTAIFVVVELVSVGRAGLDPTWAGEGHLGRPSGARSSVELGHSNKWQHAISHRPLNKGLTRQFM